MICTTENVNNSYSSILKVVRDDGWNISEAISKFGFCRASFYRKITKEQKQELYVAKKLHRSKELEFKYLIQ